MLTDFGPILPHRVDFLFFSVIGLSNFVVFVLCFDFPFSCISPTFFVALGPNTSIAVPVSVFCGVGEGCIDESSLLLKRNCTFTIQGGLM